MLVLAIDSSTAKASVALCDEEKVLSSFNIEDGKTHSEKLVPMIEHVVSEAGIKLSDIDCFAASAGPGSFTGLRIGIVTVKSIAMVMDKPCAPVPTLDALAYNCAEYTGIVCPMIDARNNQVFTAIYNENTKLTEYLAEHIEEVSQRLVGACTENSLKNVILVGDAAKKHEEFFKDKLFEHGISVEAASAEKIGADAVSVAHIAFKMVKEGKTVPSDEFVPEYLRLSSAEQALLKKRAEQEFANV